MRLNADTTEIDEHTTTDLIATAAVSNPHDAVRCEVIGQVGAFALRTQNIVRGSGGDVMVVTQHGSTRRQPDCTLRPSRRTGIQDSRPRVVVETDYKTRTSRWLVEWCRGYFAVDCVRSVIGIKFFERRVDGTFAALALQYGRDENGAVQLLQVQSFGTAPIDRVYANLPVAEESTLVELTPLATEEDLRGPSSPWTGNHTLVVPGADCVYWNGSVDAMIPGADPAAHGDLRIDLFGVLCAFDDAHE